MDGLRRMTDSTEECYNIIPRNVAHCIKNAAFLMYCGQYDQAEISRCDGGYPSPRWKLDFLEQL